MKKGLLLITALLLLLPLCACGNDIDPKDDATSTTVSTEATPSATTHTHNWKNATCTTPKTCSVCGKTEGSAKTHDWRAATCVAPKTCFICGKTEGSAKPTHTWKAATCAAPKTCSVCGETEGLTANHSWKAATCTTPKTCSVCGTTEGLTANHSWKAATCLTPKICSVCGTTEGLTANHSWEIATCTTPKTCSLCKKTEGEALGHKPEELSATNGHNIDSTITYQCSRCPHKYQETIKKLDMHAETDFGIRYTVYGMSHIAECTVTATGGYGTYQYKYEVFTSGSSTTPSLTKNFSNNASYEWQSYTSCVGDIVQVTVKDEAGNEVVKRFTVQ